MHTYICRNRLITLAKLSECSSSYIRTEYHIVLSTNFKTVPYLVIWELFASSWFDNFNFISFQGRSSKVLSCMSGWQLCWLNNGWWGRSTGRWYWIGCCRHLGASGSSGRMQINICYVKRTTRRCHNRLLSWKQ